MSEWDISSDNLKDIERLKVNGEWGTKAWGTKYVVFS